MKLLTTALLTLVLGFFSLQSSAQSKISGSIVDESDKAKLANATVMLLQAKDSILVDFTRVNADGKFSINNPDNQDHLLIVSYPKFGDYFQTIKKGAGNVSLGEIELQSAANLIEEVLIKGKIPVVIKGDTTEYDASSFVTEKNAKVEDLLKVLPGISVDASGKITAQGKTVEKVLVDGEEFFGDDPTLVTRNIRSDMVDKVQVYEKKSEQAERTGVDDGTRIQTINVKLKEDAKNGSFGKAELAGGVGDKKEYYMGKLAYNKFKGSFKLGAYLMGSTDGKFSLSWQEQEKFNMSDTESGMTSDGGFYMVQNADEFSNWDGKGHPKAISLGASVMDAWKDKKHKLNASYKFARIENDVFENTLIQNATNEGIINTDKNQNSGSDANKHRMNAKYDFAIDSLSTLTLKVSADRTHADRSTNVDANTWRDGTLASDNTSSQQELSNRTNLTYNAFFTRKLKKEGRSIALTFAGSNAERNNELQVMSELNNRITSRRDTVDQFKDGNSKTDNLNASIVYSEPLSKRWRSSIGYDYSQSKAHSVLSSFNKNAAGEYKVFDREFSNDFNFDTRTSAANLTFGYKSDKIDFNVTNVLRHDDMNMFNNLDNIDLKRDYLNYTPNARLRYAFTKTKALGLSYRRNTQLPSLTQIQPLRQNTDQLNQTIGNENLKPSINNSFSLDGGTYEMMKGRYMYLGSGVTQTKRAIQLNETVFPDGSRIMMYDNSDKDAYSAYLYGGSGFNVIAKQQIKADIHLGANYSSSYNLIRDVPRENYEGIPYAENKSTTYDYNIRFGLEKNTTKGVDFRVGARPGWRVMKSTFTPDRNSEGFTLEGDAEVRAYLPAKFQLYADLAYTYEAPTKTYAEKFERTIFTPGVSKKFLKGENLVVDFYVNDILNQNKGFSRRQTVNSFTQQTFNTISRYFMLKVSWDFTSMKGAE